MGARASQLRNRQQVQDSSVAIASIEGNQSMGSPEDGANIKALKYEQNGSYNNLSSNNNNNNNEAGADNANGLLHEDVNKLKDAIHAAAQAATDSSTGRAENGDTQQSNGGDVPQANGTDSCRRSSKTSTLQRQASQIQSLAQRIRRSSSVRRFLPTFGKRKVCREKGARIMSKRPTIAKALPDNH